MTSGERLSHDSRALAALVNDADAYDFRNAFNYSQAPLPPARMVMRPLPPWAKHLRISQALANDPS